ncbi:hypothetical protein J7F03_40320 [Streptomyces sp. ISL-43]|nr:hypothetical protein [Streptomyces sp. ISL-43]
MTSTRRGGVVRTKTIPAVLPPATDSPRLPQPRLCAAIVDRLTFGGNIIETGTDSYRLATTPRPRRAASRCWLITEAGSFAGADLQL